MVIYISIYVSFTVYVSIHAPQVEIFGPAILCLSFLRFYNYIHYNFGPLSFSCVASKCKPHFLFPYLFILCDRMFCSIRTQHALLFFQGYQSFAFSQLSTLVFIQSLQIIFIPSGILAALSLYIHQVVSHRTIT